MVSDTVAVSVATFSVDLGVGAATPFSFCGALVSVGFAYFAARFAFQTASLFFRSVTNSAYGSATGGAFGAVSIGVSSTGICWLLAGTAEEFDVGFLPIKVKEK